MRAEPSSTTGELTLGNFGIAAPTPRAELGPDGPSRVFRGLIDEVKVFDRVLELAEIQEAQLVGAVPVVRLSLPTGPQDQTVLRARPPHSVWSRPGTAP